MINRALIIILIILLTYHVAPPATDSRSFAVVSKWFGHCSLVDSDIGCVWEFPNGKLLKKISILNQLGKIRVVIKLNLFEWGDKFKINSSRAARSQLSKLLDSKIEYDLVRKEFGILAENWSDAANETMKIISAVSPPILSKFLLARPI